MCDKSQVYGFTTTLESQRDRSYLALFWVQGLGQPLNPKAHSKYCTLRMERTGVTMCLGPGLTLPPQKSSHGGSGLELGFRAKLEELRLQFK